LKLKDEDLLRHFGINRFHVIMGNPPFQDPFKSGDNKLYLDFIRFSNSILAENGSVCFVVPRTALDYLTMKKKKKIFDRQYNITFLDDSDVLLKNKYFPKVGSTFIYFVYTNSGEYESTNVIKNENGNPRLVSINLFQQSSLSTLDQEIADKIFHDTRTYDFKDFIFDSGSTRRIRQSTINSGVISKTPTDTHKVKIINKLNVSNPFPGEVFYYTKADVDINKDKVVFSGTGYLFPTIDKTHEYTYSDNFKYLLCTSNSCEELKLLFTSPLVEYITKKFKSSGFNDNIFFEKLAHIRPVKGITTVDDIYTQLNIVEYKDYIEQVANAVKAPDIASPKTVRKETTSSRKTRRSPSRE